MQPTHIYGILFSNTKFDGRKHFQDMHCNYNYEFMVCWQANLLYTYIAFSVYLKVVGVKKEEKLIISIFVLVNTIYRLQ